MVNREFFLKVYLRTQFVLLHMHPKIVQAGSAFLCLIFRYTGSIFEQKLSTFGTVVKSHTAFGEDLS